MLIPCTGGLWWPARNPCLLTDFRNRFHHCLTRRADTQLELCDTILCADGPVSTLVGLSLASEHHRGYGALYDGLNEGQIDKDKFRADLLALPIPRDTTGRIVLAVDISNHLTPPSSPTATHNRASSASAIGMKATRQTNEVLLACCSVGRSCCGFSAGCSG